MDVLGVASTTSAHEMWTAPLTHPMGVWLMKASGMLSQSKVGSVQGSLWRVMRNVVIVAALCCVAIPTTAQDRSVLTNMLRDGSSFRVRSRAAMALGRTGNSSMARPLEAALLDRHPVVRASAATALGRIGASRSVPALRAAARDRSGAVVAQARTAIRLIESKAAVARTPPMVRRIGTTFTTVAAYSRFSAIPSSENIAWQRVRYAVVIGEMRNQSGFQGSDLSDYLGRKIEAGLRRYRRLAVLRPENITSEVRERLRRRKVPQFRVEGNLKKVSKAFSVGKRAMRAEVSLLLYDEPQRNLRSMLKGAATGMELPRGPRSSQERRLARQALDGAVHAALQNAWRAIEGAAVRRDLGMTVPDPTVRRTRRVKRR